MEEYWSDPDVRATYAMLIPGVNSLLSHGAGNGFGERVFGKLGRVITKHSKNMNAERKMGLHINGPNLKAPGYERIEEWTPNEKDYDMWLGPFDTSECFTG